MQRNSVAYAISNYQEVRDLHIEKKMFTPRGLRVVKALEKFTKVKNMYFDTSSILNKIKFTSLNDNLIQATFKVDSYMCNGCNIVHGGFIATIIDISCVYGYLGKTNGKILKTTHLCINYIQSAEIGDNITVEVKTVKNGNTPLMEACLWKEDGAIIAKGTASFVIGNEQYQKYCAECFDLDFTNND